MTTASAAERQALLETARAMNRAGLNRGSAGNLSLRLADGFLITPSGMDYAHCTPDDMVPMDLAGRAHGTRRPSSEWRFHRDLYRARPEVGAVLHAHPPWCTTLACLRRDIPAFHYLVALAGGDSIRCAEYARFGSQALSDHVLAALRDRTACLMANHGLLCVAADLPGVLTLAGAVEELAQWYGQALAIGEPARLDRQQMAEVLAAFARYGQQDEA